MAKPGRRGRAFSRPHFHKAMPLWTEKYKFIHRLEGLKNGLGDEIAKSLEGALGTITGKIIILEEKAKQTESLIKRKKYLNQQKAEIERVLNEVYEDIGKKIETKTFEMAQATPKIINSMIIKSVPAKFEITTEIPKLDEKRIASWFQSSQIEGTYFNDWLTKLESNSVARIVKETRESLILSEPRRETAKRIQNALNIGRQSAEGLAHNAVHQAHVWAEREYYLENENIFKGLRFVAELDRKTTPLCRSLDGQEFPLKQAPQPPLHWRCRSFLMPVFRSESLENYLAAEEKNVRIARIESEPRIVKHRDSTRSTTFEKLRVKHPQASINYNEWLMSMVNSSDARDVSFAREVLGPTRFDLLSSRKLKMESLYYQGKLRTIKELERLTQ